MLFGKGFIGRVVFDDLCFSRPPRRGFPTAASQARSKIKGAFLRFSKIHFFQNTKIRFIRFTLFRFGHFSGVFQNLHFSVVGKQVSKRGFGGDFSCFCPKITELCRKSVRGFQHEFLLRATCQQQSTPKKSVFEKMYFCIFRVFRVKTKNGRRPNCDRFVGSSLPCNQCT